MSEESIVQEGYLEGLGSSGLADLRLAPGATVEQELRHAGRLAGHLAAAGGGAEATRPFHFEYATALAMDAGQRMLGELSESDLLNAHRFGCAWVERRGALTVREEQDLFGWLLDQAGVAQTPTLFAQMRARRPGRQAIVARRIARQAHGVDD